MPPLLGSSGGGATHRDGAKLRVRRELVDAEPGATWGGIPLARLPWASRPRVPSRWGRVPLAGV